MEEKPLVSFDYAIKYLLKDKGDYEIVEGFISALLQSQGYKPVKIWPYSSLQRPVGLTMEKSVSIACISYPQANLKVFTPIPLFNPISVHMAFGDEGGNSFENFTNLEKFTQRIPR